MSTTAHEMYGIAKKMLDVKNLDHILATRITRVIELVEKAHPRGPELGTLRSTQVLANVILNWELDNERKS
jgi:hypothetical protein